MKRILFTMLLALTAANLAAAQDKVDIASPGGNVAASFFMEDARLKYSIDLTGAPAVLPSPLGIIIDGNDLGDNAAIVSTSTDSFDETYPTRGVHSTAVNHYNQLNIELRKGDQPWTLQVRAYDDGLAYRYLVPGRPDRQRKIQGEVSGWRFPDACAAWLQPYIVFYENVHSRYELADVPVNTQICLPVTVRLPTGQYCCATEADLVDYSGLSLKVTDKNLLTAQFNGDPKGWEQASDVCSPWRLTIAVENLNALVNTDLLTNLCPPPDEFLRDADWINPAVVAWQWWSVDAPKLEDQKWWVDKTAELGLRYYLIDDGWRFWKTDDKCCWELLQGVVDYARAKNVNILIWSDNRYVSDALNRWAFMSTAKRVGVKGFKFDFMNSESRDMVNWYEDTLRDAARLQLMVNFHGACKPTGRSRHWPNEMTREGIRGLEQNKWGKLPARHYAVLPFTRFIAGPADFTPITFDPVRVRGTTFAFQLATAFIYTSPQLHLADRLDRYLESPALPLIKALKSTWDQTIVLEGTQIGEFVAFARRSGRDWYVAAINAGPQIEYPLGLSFLPSGRFNAFLAKDNLQSSPELLTEEIQVTSADKLTVTIPQSGGFAVHFQPIQ